MNKAFINSRFSEAVSYLTNNREGLSKGDIADLLGLKNSTFSEILNGRMNAATDHVANLCSLYNISAEWILTGKGPMLKDEYVNDTGCTIDDNTKLIRELIANNGDLRQQLGEQIKENETLKKQIEELQEKKIHRFSAHSGASIAAESEK